MLLIAALNKSKWAGLNRYITYIATIETIRNNQLFVWVPIKARLNIEYKQHQLIIIILYITSIAPKGTDKNLQVYKTFGMPQLVSFLVFLYFWIVTHSRNSVRQLPTYLKIYLSSVCSVLPWTHLDICCRPQSLTLSLSRVARAAGILLSSGPFVISVNGLSFSLFLCMFIFWQFFILYSGEEIENFHYNYN